MAFLDNSGDIILDAVLTAVGRRRMANGDFRITKFALGDDEINYGLYDIDHPSGSAYYDLEILQTPIYEAGTGQEATINYGLLSITRTNLLYMPSIKVNEGFDTALQMSGNVFYLAVNGETYDRVKSNTVSPPAPLGTNGEKVLQSGVREARAIYFESGIDTTEETANSINRQSFITSLGLLDSNFMVSVDTRFLVGVMGLSGRQPFQANENSDKVTVPFTLGAVKGGSRNRSLTNYTDFTVRGVDNLLFAPTSTSRTDPSVIRGPRGTGAALSFAVRSQMTNTSDQSTPNEFSKFGRTQQAVFGGSDLYDMIDTTVYVTGLGSTATAQFPLRILRYAGS